MPIRYIPIDPIVLRGQAVLGGFTRALRYAGDGRSGQRLARGLPLYEARLEEAFTPQKQQKTANAAENTAKSATNLIVHGECQAACAHLLATGQQVDLVYIDPPFASGANYGKQILLRRHPSNAALPEREALESEGWEEKLYGDIWNKEDYLSWMFENLVAIKSVMSDTASIYVHLDWHIGHYVKILLDEVFGEENFVNEVVWRYPNKMSGAAAGQSFVKTHDTLFLYGKTDHRTYNKLREARDEPVKQSKRVKVDNKNMRARDEEGNVIYEDSFDINVNDVWDIPYISSTDAQRLDYPTQKPEALLERIISACSHEGMVVADFFGGSGVTAATAHKLGRRFVHADIGVNSIQTVRDRLVAAQAPFERLRLQDGVQLFRNPEQTNDKLAALVPGLASAASLGTKQALPAFWAGILAGSSDGLRGAVPVHLPNLLDSASRVLDEAALHKLTMEELPQLVEWDYPVQQVVVYYIDIAEPAACEKWLAEHNPSGIAVELRDLKPLLGDVVLGDELQAHCTAVSGGWQVKIDRYFSSYLDRKLKSQVAKKKLQPSTSRDAAQLAALPAGLSADGLECIEWLSVDCAAAQGVWTSSVEAKIDSKNRLWLGGVKQTTAWDGLLHVPAASGQPLRIKVRNVAGDETTVAL